MLDGLQSETAGHVCVMMTAMNIAALPPALVRSGRIELWLETRLPDEAGRAAILAAARVPAPLESADSAKVAAATDGFTGADLKRLVEDAKLLYAFDRSRGMEARSATEYFLSAAETIKVNKQRYAQAEAAAPPPASRPPWFHVAMAEAEMANFKPPSPP